MQTNGSDKKEVWMCSSYVEESKECRFCMFVPRHRTACRITVGNTAKRRAELYAFLLLVRSCGTNATVYTDSDYVHNVVTSWLRKWLTEGYVTVKGQPVKNIDLVQQLGELHAYNVDAQHVHHCDSNVNNFFTQCTAATEAPDTMPLKGWKIVDAGRTDTTGNANKQRRRNEGRR
jgi:ribonuclease HI